eukprot:6186585-Pleurochrysis_carterae.AAC.6
MQFLMQVAQSFAIALYTVCLRYILCNGPTSAASCRAQGAALSQRTEHSAVVRDATPPPATRYCGAGAEPQRGAAQALPCCRNGTRRRPGYVADIALSDVDYRTLRVEYKGSNRRIN